MKAFLRQLVVLLVFGLAAVTAFAKPSNPQLNVDYQMLAVPQDAEAGKKVEIIEFFGYFCGHCYQLDLPITNWARQNKNRVLFRRVHVKFGDGMAMQQRMFYTLAAMGELTNGMHHKIFKAMQEQRYPFRTDVQVFRWIEENGIDRPKFVEMFNSFYVDALCQQGVGYLDTYKVDGVPMVVVDGRFVTSPAIISEGNKTEMTEQEAINGTLKVLDNLVNRALQERVKKR
ncbi:MAG: thiol:disulfide interchange protein DsbA/DsbL [Oxalobacter sp.]|nr:thiol:disulfide interchange protein DsbA/DsbL [Oxalobacter sp.]